VSLDMTDYGQRNIYTQQVASWDNPNGFSAIFEALCDMALTENLMHGGFK